jgi:hypothetical protein
MVMIRRAALALVVLVLALTAASAAAQTKFPTRLTLKDERTVAGDVISGTVRSKAHSCESRRRVRLHHRAVSEEAPSTIVAKLRTDSKGNWSFTPKANQNGDRFATPGDYRVKVGEVKLRGDDGGITCKEKNSSSLFIG